MSVLPILAPLILRADADNINEPVSIKLRLDSIKEAKSDSEGILPALNIDFRVSLDNCAIL